MKRVLAALLAAIVLSVGAWTYAEPAAASRTTGTVTPVLWATATGVDWSGVTHDFIRNAPITYHWELYKDGAFFYANEHGGYFTDGGGYHYRLPPGFPQAVDCGPGRYDLWMWVTVDGQDTSTWRSHVSIDKG